MTTPNKSATSFVLAVVGTGGFLAGVLGTMLLVRMTRPEIPVPIPPPITLPTTAKCDVGRMLLLEAATPGKSPVKWWVSDRIVDWHQEEASLYLTCPRAGRYTVLAWTVHDGKPTGAAECVVTFGAPGPDPDPPGPDPVPVDPLVKEMQAAYTADTGATKADSLKALHGFYVGLVGLAGRSTAKTWGDLFDETKDAAKAAGISGKLMGMQAILQKELQAAVPVKRDEPLTEQGKATAANVFRKLATAIGQVKP